MDKREVKTCMYCQCILVEQTLEEKNANIERKNNPSREHCFIPNCVRRQENKKLRPFIMYACKGCNNMLGVLYDRYNNVVFRNVKLDKIDKLTKRMTYGYIRLLRPLYEELAFFQNHPKFILSVLEGTLGKECLSS